MITSTEVIHALNGAKREYMEALRKGPVDEAMAVRLCVWRDGSWQVFTGPVDYDPVHAPVCAAGIIMSHTDTCELASELIEEVGDQLDMLFDEEQADCAHSPMMHSDGFVSCKHCNEPLN